MTSTQQVSGPGVSRRAGRYRRRRAFVVGGLAVVLFAIALLIGQLSAKPPAPPSANVGTQLDQVLPAAIRQLPLTDEYGNSTNLAAFDGKIVVLTDFMTECQEICPITTAQLNHIDKTVTSAGLAGKVQFVNITVDPERDTPQRLHAYRDFASLLPNWTLLTGTPDNLAMLWKYFGASYSKQAVESPAPVDWLTGTPMTYDVIHSDVLVYLDAAGHERFVIQGMPDGIGAPLTPAEQAFLSDQGRSNLTGSDDAAWTEPQAMQVVSWLTKKQLHAAS